MNYQLDLTGNEARFLFYSIKNKKSEIAQRVRDKLLQASDVHVLKNVRKEIKRNENQATNRNRLTEG